MPPSRLRRRLLPAALMLVAVACAGQGTETVAYDETPVAIVITTTTGDVIVDADRSVNGVEIESQVANTDITTDLVDGVLMITDDCDGDGCSVNYFVQMRGDVSVEVTTESGTISVANITGDAKVTSQTGLITLSAVQGSVVAATEDARIIATRMESALADFSAGKGPIDVSFDVPVEALVATTGEGDVTVQLPDSAAYAITTSTADGDTDIVVDNDPASDKTVSLTTGGGDIEIYRS